MSKSTRRALNLLGFLCLLGFFIPGSMHGTSSYYRIVLGLIQPGWCVIYREPLGANGFQSGVSYQASWSWLLVAAATVLASLASGRKTPRASG